MMYKKYILTLIGFLAILAAVSYLSSEMNSPEIKVSILEPIYKDVQDINATANVELIFLNNSTEKVELTDIMVTSFFGGYNLGSKTIESLLLPPSKETELLLQIDEYWAEVPSFEPGLYYEYSISAKIDGEEVSFGKIIPSSRIILPEIPTEMEPPEGIPDPYLDEFYANIQSGGPGKDGIPPIDEPKYISVLEAEDNLADHDIVFMLQYGKDVYLFPRYILVWHEIVNINLGGDPVSVTYCPLTGSVIGYNGVFGKVNTSLGTSGRLINSNLVMYDRATDSLWPQILGVSIRGESKQESLITIPIFWTRWGLVKDIYPDALVLSEETGFLKPYGSDPYGSYMNPDSYYLSGPSRFSVMNMDSRLKAKEIVVGVKYDGVQYAVTKSIVSTEKVVNLGDDLVAFYDPELETVSVYSNSLNSSRLRFEFHDGSYLDDLSGSIWNHEGVCVEGEYVGSSLSQVTHFDVMWFAWVAYYPDTVLIL